MPGTPELQFRAMGYEARDIRDLTAFLKLVWPDVGRLNPEYLNWLYVENPSGTAIGMNAWSGDKLVGHYVIVPISAQYNGSQTRAALSLNTAVHPDFRGQGLFKKLAERTYDSAAHLKVDHVVGVANANSTPGFIRSLGFQLVAPLPARMFMRCPRSAISSQFKWSRSWSKRELQWRLKNPACRYSFQEHSGTLEVNAPTQYPGLSCVLKLESDPERMAVIRSNLTVKRNFRPRLWFGMNRDLHFAPLTSVKVPGPLRPAALNLIFKSLQEPAQLDARDVEFNALDFDVV